MTLRRALDQYKRDRVAGRRFPGERRTTSGLFSGLDDRLVYVDRGGRLRDYGRPLCGLSGLERARFGVHAGGETTWLDECETTDQSYHGETGLVETTHEAEEYTVAQSDLTLERTHLTRVALDGTVPEDATLRVAMAFAPEGRDHQLGHLVHEDAVEAYHDTQHHYVTASTGITDVTGQVPERPAALVDEEPSSFPRNGESGRYEETTLSGRFLLTVPLSDGAATVATLLTDVTERSREEALSSLADLATAHGSDDALRTAAGEQFPFDLPASLPLREVVVTDLRVLSLLAADTGAHIAGPDFDPLYANSGGYGYTWFRDDAEIATFLLESGRTLGLSLGEVHERTAEFYCATQCEDGTWPHRVWPYNGHLAPGWANARIEGGQNTDYQADQSASVLTFLARYARASDAREEPLASTIEAGFDGLVDALAASGLPAACQNAWEDMHGQFAHTAGTFLQAFAALAAAPVEEHIQRRASEHAAALLDSLDELWVPERGSYALRLTAGDPDDRLDAASLALVAAHREYAATAELPEETVDRLVSHVDTTLTGLRRETDAVTGLIRYEGDEWRRNDQTAPKIWTVSTAWGAHAAAQLGTLLAGRDDPRADEWYRRSRWLLDEVLPGGSLVPATGYLPEQVFDDGTPDSATPLGWPHAIRLATVAHLANVDALEPAPEAH